MPRLPRAGPSPPRSIHLTARDGDALAFAAEHRFVLADQVAALLGIDAGRADARLRALTAGGYLVRDRVFVGQPPMNRISGAGLAAIGADLPAPRKVLHSYEHDVGLAWLWLAARRGMFGPAQSVIGERRLRSQDGRREAGQPPLAVRLGGLGPGGQERLHYPDLLVITRGRKRIALELELTAKGPARQERILAGYETDDRVHAVVYLVTDKGLGRSIAGSARRLGIEPRVYVRVVRFGSTTTADGVGATAALGVSKGQGVGATAALGVRKGVGATAAPGVRKGQGVTGSGAGDARQPASASAARTGESR